jgi:multiple sugar transport system ATP-binding protein
MAGVDISGVRKRFGQVEVIRGVSVRIEDGEFAVLVGPSGCGKSTLLRMIAGLEEVTEGEIRIDERIVNDLEPQHRDIAMVFQSYALYPHMSVAENMTFSMRMRDASREESDGRLARAAKILGLEDLLQRYPRELSGGQRQRVAMGRAIVRDPRVFLFDEPLSNLDAKLRVAMRGEIKSLQRRLGTTTIYVTHDQVEAMTMADKIVVMRDGTVEQIGAPLDLYDRPANRFVAGFLGSPAMNFCPGRIERGCFRPEHGTPWTTVPAPAALEGSAVVFGIRPEHVRIEGDGIDAIVQLVEAKGAETDVAVAIDGLPLVCVVRERVRHVPGDTVRLAFDAAMGHLFDHATGVRLASPPGAR